jgi:hypothetical protein
MRLLRFISFIRFAGDITDPVFLWTCVLSMADIISTYICASRCLSPTPKVTRLHPLNNRAESLVLVISVAVFVPVTTLEYYVY